MRLFAAVLVAWYLALSVTPQAAIPSGVGVSIAWQRGPDWAAHSLEMLQPPIWHNWVYDHLDDPTYTPMAYSLRLAAQDNYLEAAVTHEPRLWLLGSEPNLASTYITPAEAAQAVQRWRDNYEGPIACCGTVQWAGWEQWLDAYLAAGGPVPDYWHVHVFDTYAYPPLSFFEAWMQAHDAVRPILVTETACPWCDVAGNKRLMSEWAKLLADGDVLAVVWYSDVDYWQLWPTTNLLSDDGTTLALLGEHYLSLTNIDSFFVLLPWLNGD